MVLGHVACLVSSVVLKDGGLEQELDLDILAAFIPLLMHLLAVLTSWDCAA